MLHPKFAIVIVLALKNLPGLCLSESVMYFDQKIDHYSEVNWGEQTFKQKVIINEDYFDSSNNASPIFIYTGNEGPIEGFYEASGFVLTLAEKYKALVVFAEHRFYGDSLPLGESYSFKWPGLGVLTVDQATADYAFLLVHIKQHYNLSEGAVICFGGSYGGMLSAYMRFKYPNVVDGALAASAPVRMADSKEARSLFWVLATKDYDEVGTDVVDTVRSGFKAMDDLAEMGVDGLESLSETFKLCNTMENSTDYTQLLYSIRNAFVEITMFDYPYPTDFSGAPLPAWPVNYSSSLIRDADSPIDAIFQVMNLVYNDSSNPTCFNPYELYFACADPTGCGQGTSAISWDFQVCYEINLAYGSTGVNDMFPNLPWSDEERDAYCTATYGITSRHDWFGVNFWGSDVWSTSNIIWSNGLLDPWHGSGILSSSDYMLPTVILDQGAHHLDLRAPNNQDPESVTEARATEEELIGKIIDISAKYKKKLKKH